MTVARAVVVGLALVVPDCPHCHRRHVHGGDAGGVRLSHCLDGARPYDVCVVNGPAELEDVHV